MAKQLTAPYGSWKSPITSDLIVQGSISLVSAKLEGTDIYWTEARPGEAGRNVVMKQKESGEIEEMTPAPFNVRTRVHEYGGGAYTIHKGTLIFSNFADNLLYVRAADGSIRTLTSDGNKRYADGRVHDKLDKWIGVREDHTKSAIFAETTLVALSLDGSGEQVLVSGNDFYSNPRVSPDGSKLCWLTWNHPNMPWDETELWVGEFAEDGQIRDAKKVAGGNGISIVQPVWSPSGELFFVSDASNWWNIMRLDGTTEKAICEVHAEFGSPAWQFGMSDYVFMNASTIVCNYAQDGRRHLAVLNVETGALSSVDTTYTQFASLSSNGSNLVCLAASPTSSTGVVVFDVNHVTETVIRQASDIALDAAYLAKPQPIEFPTEHGLTAHAIYYAPTNPDYVAPSTEKPPLLVHVHGGPTSATPAVLSLGTQYWTSRGFAVVDVNYGGSTGYGREYRDRLKGQWGIVDVDDSTNAALYLVEQGLADRDRIAIAGGSAGGYTTLAALTFKDVFRAGASHFGLSELEVFAKETHKFESRYMDGLLGPYPEAKDVYFNRSPINFTDKLSCPVIFFQGLDDKVVPPNQAELMVNALIEKGLPVAYVAFEGEGHGFRMSQNVKRALDGELYFYGKVFGFEPADEIDPVEIRNL